MHHPKSGKTSRTISRLTSGPWVLYSMRWWRWIHPSRQETWRDFSIRWSRDNTRRSQLHTLLTSLAWSPPCWKSVLSNGHRPSKSSICPSSLQSIMRVSEKVEFSVRKVKNWLVQLKCPKTCHCWRSDCLPASMKFNRMNNRRRWNNRIWWPTCQE